MLGLPHCCGLTMREATRCKQHCIIWSMSRSQEILQIHEPLSLQKPTQLATRQFVLDREEQCVMTGHLKACWCQRWWDACRHSVMMLLHAKIHGRAFSASTRVAFHSVSAPQNLNEAWATKLLNGNRMRDASAPPGEELMSMLGPLALQHPEDACLACMVR